MSFWETAALEPLGWTILHSLWQGALIALVVAASQAALPRSSARIRYAAACAGLALLLLAPAATFLQLRGGPGTELAGSNGAGGIMRPMGPPVPGAVATSWRDGVAPLLPWVVGLWACGVVGLSGRLLGAWWLLQTRLRNVPEEAPEEWRMALRRVQDQMVVSQPVRLLRSAALSTPAVVGWLRPVILIPPAVVAGLSTQQLEAILAHELAHIRRHDYLVNLLQTAVETLLFYHPAAWWLSGRIRQEREHCADDLAAAACGSPADYASALLMLEEARPSLAMAASGGSLKTRIERLLSPAPPAFPYPTVAVLAGLTVVVALAMPALLAQEMPRTYAKWLDHDVVYIITDSQRQTFEDLTSDEARNDFIAQFWRELDPDTSTSENEFQTEHYRRIAYANERFSRDKAAGWKTERGRIYILHGPPDEIESHPADGNEMWRYRGPLADLGNDVIFHFDLTGKRPVVISN